MQLKAFVLDTNLLQLREVRELGIFSVLCAAETWSALKICLKFTEVAEGRDYRLPNRKTSCLLRLNIISNALWFMLNTAAFSPPVCRGIQGAFHRYPIWAARRSCGETGYVFIFSSWGQGNSMIERVTDWMRMKSWSQESRHPGSRCPFLFTQCPL